MWKQYITCNILCLKWPWLNRSKTLHTSSSLGLPRRGTVYLHNYTSYRMLCVWRKYSMLDSHKTPYNSDVKVLSLPTAHGWIRLGCMTMLDTTTVNLGFKINTCILCQSVQLFVYQWWHKVLLTNDDMRFCLPIMTWGFAYQWWHEVLLTNDDIRFCLPMMIWGFAYQWWYEV